MAKCLNCGKDTGRNAKFCCQACRAAYLRNIKKCVICGAEFYSPPSAEQYTCGKRACQIAYRRKLMERPDRKVDMLKGLEASHAIERTDRNTHAKTWEIHDPDGNNYEFTNMTLWAREHADILPSVPVTFCNGIRDIKRGRSKTYKGWSLVKARDVNMVIYPDGIMPDKKERALKMSEDEKLERKRKREKIRYVSKKIESIDPESDNLTRLSDYIKDYGMSKNEEATFRRFVYDKRIPAVKFDNKWYIDRGYKYIHDQIAYNRHGKYKTIPKGSRFGKLTVIGDPIRQTGKQTFYECRCDCGNIVTVRSDRLSKGGQVSCGCSRRKPHKNKKHPEA